MKRFASCLAVGLFAVLAYPVISYFFPPLSIEFWRLAWCKEVTYDADRLHQFCALERSPSAAFSFRMLFDLGTREAKLYALAGIHWHQGKRDFEAYAEELRKLGGEVRVHVGDTVTDDPVESWIQVVRDGDLPLYRGKESPNQRPDGTSAKAPPSNPSQVSGVPHP
jgi:hypothetical protein